MSGRQRLTFLAIAVAIAVVAIIVLADSSEDDTEPDQTAATATATPTPEASPAEEETATPTPTPTPTPRPQPPLLTAGKVTELEFTEGETIRFRVRSADPEEIHVHCYDITRDVPAGETISVSFKASITGICEVEFHNSGEPIAELRVEPK
jgi:FtsP/CotA-like multicopper oxidase with cupredoxin domain